jgi:hypothetical protein
MAEKSQGKISCMIQGGKGEKGEDELGETGLSTSGLAEDSLARTALCNKGKEIGQQEKRRSNRKRTIETNLDGG